MGLPRNNKLVGQTYGEQASVVTTSKRINCVWTNGINHQTAYRYVISLTANYMMGNIAMRIVHDWWYFQIKCLVEFSLLSHPLSLAAGH
jgi:hypothetical protein